MIYMPVPKDIRTFEPRAIGPFTKRQSIALGAAFVLAGLLYMTVGKIIDSNQSMYAIIITLCAPILMCGFIDIYGMPVWVFVKDVAIEKVTAPKQLIYKTRNTYESYGKQNRITYEYFDSDDDLTEKEKAKKKKNRKNIAKKRLKRFYQAHPELMPLQ